MVKRYELSKEATKLPGPSRVEICRHNSGIDILYDAGALVLAPPFAFRRHSGGELVDFAGAPLAADAQMKECL